MVCPQILVCTTLLSQKKSEANDFGQLLLFCLEGKSGQEIGLLRTS